MKKITNFDIKQALAWVHGDKGIIEMNNIYGYSSKSYIIIARTLRQYILEQEDRDNGRNDRDEDSRVDER